VGKSCGEEEEEEEEEVALGGAGEEVAGLFVVVGFGEGARADFLGAMVRRDGVGGWSCSGRVVGFRRGSDAVSGSGLWVLEVVALGWIEPRGRY
jgi:hypothetical protein